MIQQFIKFCVVGGSGVFVDFGVTYLCKEWLRLNKYGQFAGVPLCIDLELCPEPHLDVP